MNFQKPIRILSSVLNAANHDFCPNMNRYVYWLKQPFGWVISAMLFSILIGLLVGPQGYVLAFAFLALLVLGLVWPWLSMKGIRCKLIIPTGQLREHETGELTFRVRNYWPIPVFGVIVKGDFLQEIDLEDEPIAFSLKRIPAFSDTDFPISITPRRRGILPSGDVQISNGFPFGLADVAKQIEDLPQALVWPASESLQGSPPADGCQFTLSGALSDQSGNEGETIGVRGYRTGDRLRNVHWAQTVRSQQLMVRERQTPSSTIATVLLDLDPANHVGVGVDNSFEWAIRIGASICNQLHQSQSKVRVVCIGLPRATQNSTVNRHSIGTVMDFLAGLPTLEMQQQIDRADLQTAQDHSRFYSNQTFLVCTSRSSVCHLDDSALKPVMIELSGFENEPQDAGNGHRTDEPKQKLGFTVTTPQLAPSQLAFAWKRSFGSAAS